MRGLRALDDPNPLVQKVLFGGEKGAKTVPKGAGPGLPIEEAKAREKAGLSALENFNQTGWYRGPDQQWKWILSDKGAALNPDAFQTYITGETDLSKPSKAIQAVKLNSDEPRKLFEVLNHPTLYETYPHLKNATVARMPAEEAKSSGGALASYNPRTNTVLLADGRPTTEVLTSMLHELQHGVQTVEGFGTGSNLYQNLPADVLSGKRPPTSEDVKSSRELYTLTSGEVEARQVEKQFETQNWSQLPTQMKGFPAPDKQLVRDPQGWPSVGRAYQQFVPVDHDPFNGANPFAYRDDVINTALPARWTNDIVIQPETSHARQGYAPPDTGEFRGDTPPLVGIPPSPWNRPKVDLERGWHDDPSKLNAPVSDEPTGAGYKSGFLSPAERGFIGAQPPRQTQQYTPVDYDPFATSALER